MDGEVKAILESIGKLEAHIKEAHKVAKSSATKAEVDERFKSIADDLAALTKERATLVAEHEQMRKDFDDLEVLSKNLVVKAGENPEHALREAKYHQQMRIVGLEHGLEFPGGESADQFGTLEEHRAATIDYMMNHFDGSKAREFMAKPAIKAIQRHALSEGDLPSGGFLVDPVLADGIIKEVFKSSPFMQIARVTDITGSNRLVELKRTGRPAAYWVGDAEEPAKSEASYGKLEILAHMVGVETVVETPLLQDVAYIETEVALDAAEEIDRLINVAFLTGDGVAKPEGFIVNAAIVADAVTGEDTSTWLVEWKDFAKLYAGQPDASNVGLATKYRQNAGYTFNSATLAKFLQFASAGNEKIPILSLAVGPQGLIPAIHGKKYTVLDDMDSDGSDGNYPLAFGDFVAAYRVVRRTGIFVIRDPLTAKPNVEFTWYMRIGGGVRLAEAIALLVCT